MKATLASLPRRLRLLPGLLSACALLSACVGTTPQWDRHFGDTVRSALVSQVLNPDAAANTAPVTGMDGRAARAAVERYHKSFAEPAAQPVTFMLGAGGGK
ncbi:hypothetical protein [Janthinobacterium agaricidamnosum]|uniref:Putative lipoprotein n=1 Tax=Janthinobacterium agaricidamnosum NBRC 102515 = DSM 9628 TaxID=1349767 RepID=W0VCQ7_9BURK|nr:hypothetical protein [Janthinobacterium agaricidamnosum]CDG85701.1 putative lipoprotein [Janthinobacterium agaricidamnosum NBRC 102515 = DSM 9628]